MIFERLTEKQANIEFPETIGISFDNCDFVYSKDKKLGCLRHLDSGQVEMYFKPDFNSKDLTEEDEFTIMTVCSKPNETTITEEAMCTQSEKEILDFIHEDNYTDDVEIEEDIEVHHSKSAYITLIIGLACLAFTIYTVLCNTTVMQATIRILKILNTK